MRDLLVILGILILCFELYRLLRGNWLRRFLKKGAEQPRKPHVMKPKSEQDCPFCVKEKGRQGSSKPEIPPACVRGKAAAVQQRKYPPKVIFVQTWNANISGST
jgi:hypothetical protein